MSDQVVHAADASEYPLVLRVAAHQAHVLQVATRDVQVRLQRGLHILPLQLGPG